MIWAIVSGSSPYFPPWVEICVDLLYSVDPDPSREVGLNAGPRSYQSNTTHGAEGVPTAGLSRSLFHTEVNLTGMGHRARDLPARSSRPEVGPLSPTATLTVISLVLYLARVELPHATMRRCRRALPLSVICLP